MATWCLLDTLSGRIDDDRIDATSRVAGLSLIARHMRRAARAGWRGAVVLVDDESARQRCQQAIAAEPPPDDFTVDYALSGQSPPEGRRYVRLSLHAVYEGAALENAVADGEPPEPMVRISEWADLRRAERALYRSIRKSVDQDGVVAYYIFRILSRQMTRLLIDTPVTPNQVSISAMVMGIVAALFATAGTLWGWQVAGVLFWFGAVIDCVDGEIARLRVKGSKLGEWLDSMADEVSTYGLLAGLGVGLLGSELEAYWSTIAFVGAVIAVVVHYKLYADLYRAGAPIDTAQYPWFFGTPSSGERAGVSANVIRWLGFCFRRDAFVTAVAIFLMVGDPRLAIVLLSGGVALIMVLLGAHLLVTTVRR